MADSTLELTLLDPEFARDWHMSLAERAALISVLKQIKPRTSIEIGTFLSGSLRPISRYSEHVYTFDIDANQHRAKPLFENVDFITGDSAVTLSPIIDLMNEEMIPLNFVLVDGSHETAGVRSDLVQCLRYVPKTGPVAILMHDSWNPAVREGIMTAPWEECSFVHDIDLDFVPGHLFDRADIEGQLWGGLAAAIMLPERREGKLSIRQSYRHSRNTLLKHSIYPD